MIVNKEFGKIQHRSKGARE